MNFREASVLNGRQETSDHVRARLNNCRILQRNFEACVDAAQTSKDPAQRERYNESATQTPANPTARDFGYLDSFLLIDYFYYLFNINNNYENIKRSKIWQIHCELGPFNFIVYPTS